MYEGRSTALHFHDMDLLLLQPCRFQCIEKGAADSLSSGFVLRAADESYRARFSIPANVVYSPLSEGERMLLRDWRPEDLIRRCQFSDPEVGFGWGFLNLRLENVFWRDLHFWSR
jgi:hypothetical protein